MLSGNLHKEMVQALGDVPMTASPGGRDTLLADIPKNIVASLNRVPDNRTIDNSSIVRQLYELGHLEDTGIRLLIIFLDAARESVKGTSAGRKLKEIIEEIEKRDEEEELAISPPPVSLPDIPEALLFAGSDERLPLEFFTSAIAVQGRIARLQVPRFFGRLRQREAVKGTGWLIAPGLLCTNYHVVAARTPKERAATDEELATQAQHIKAWFDYSSEGGPRSECQCAGLIYANKNLDYALLRLHNTQDVSQRHPLTIAAQFPLYAGDRLNIVQHPGGNPLRYAIRNNFYIGEGQTTSFIRYLTDTESGASGSPIFSDDWYVVGMHHAVCAVPPTSYRGGEIIKYHNEGIEIQAILSSLPLELSQEIAAGQGWR